MLLDIIVVIALIIGIFKGLRKGLIVATFSLAGLLIGVAAALKLSAVTAAYLSETVNLSARWLPILAFIVVFVAAVLLVRMLAAILQKSLEVAMLGWVNRIGGMVAYCFIYLLIISVIFFYSDKIGLISAQAKIESVSFPLISPVGPATIQVLGKALPFLKDIFEQLTGFFQRISEAQSPK